MTADEWLTDLETKAQAAVANWDKKYGDESDEAVNQLAATLEYIAAANPAAVLRLLAMVRNLAFSAARSRGLFDDPTYWLDTAYAATEAKTEGAQ